jgi:hypothetical protein
MIPRKVGIIVQNNKPEKKKNPYIRFTTEKSPILLYNNTPVLFADYMNPSPVTLIIITA